MNDKLQAIALENGCDPDDWSKDQQREACVELFEQDEVANPKPNGPDWINDSLVEQVGANRNERLAIIAALKHASPIMRQAALGTIFERALTRYPLDTLGQVAEENIEDWKAAERRAQLRSDADSANDAARAGA